MSTDNLRVAREVLERLGIRPDELVGHSASQSPVPTFSEYVPRVAAAVSAGTRRTYSPYWAFLTDRWPDRRLDEPSATELQTLVEEARRKAVVRSNSRGGRSAAEHMVSALRCLYRFAENDRFVSAARSPSRRITKPRRLPSARRALRNHELTQIVEAVSAGGNDQDLDKLILRLHIETACRRSSALTLGPNDLDPTQCLVRLHGKGGTVHWQPVSPTLMNMLLDHRARGAQTDGQLLRYRNGRPITRRRYDYIWKRTGRQLPWVATQQVTTHWIRHTTLTWVERHFGYATARAFAAHAEPTGLDGTTLTYVRASIDDVAAAVSALTGEPHPLSIPDEE